MKIDKNHSISLSLEKGEEKNLLQSRFKISLEVTAGKQLPEGRAQLCWGSVLKLWCFP